MPNRDLKLPVRIDRLFLAADNPRHDEVDDEAEAIALLCKSEDIEELARDIVRHGSNPAERLIVFPADASVNAEAIDQATAFIVAEGNRRVCALKLLHDPELAPVQMRETFRRLADGWDELVEIDAVVIFDRERRNHWMRRIHDGAQGGKGRKAWNAEQKTRFTGNRRNIIAQQLFDYAVETGIMAANDRKGSFSHMARLVGNALVAEALGLDRLADDVEVFRNRPREVFDIVLKTVIEEAISKKLGSQAPKAKIDDFARQLSSLEGVTATRIAPEPLRAPESQHDASGPEANDPSKKNGTAPEGTGNNPGGPNARRQGAPHSKYIREEEEITQELERVGSEKLRSLYNSLCGLNVEHHTPLIAIGAWAFIECLSASMGRKDNVAFKHFYTHDRMAKLGLGNGKLLAAYDLALEHISVYGNVTKHHATSAHFAYRQIINDLAVLKPLIVASLKEVS